MGKNNAKENAAGQPDRGLTFGVELEFLAFVPKKYRDIDYQARHVRRYITNCLTQTKVKLACPNCQAGEHYYHLPVQYSEEDHSYKAWSVTTDESVDLDTDSEEPLWPNDSTRGRMEIVSRVLNFNGSMPDPFGQKRPCTGEVLQWNHCDEIRCILEVLHQNFNKPGYRLFVNSSTGLHIHIGRGGRGLPVHLVQGLAGTMTALEHTFDEIMPTDRILGESILCEPDRPKKGEEPLPGLDTRDFAYNCRSESWDFHNNFCVPPSQMMITRLRGRIDKTFDGENTAQIRDDQWGYNRLEARYKRDGQSENERVDFLRFPFEAQESEYEVDEDTSSDSKLTTRQDSSGASEDSEDESRYFYTTEESEEESDNDFIPGSIKSLSSEAVDAWSSITISSTQAASMREDLLSFNVPAWLDLIKSRSTIEEIKGLGYNDHAASLNLSNLREPLQDDLKSGRTSKRTAEIRTHCGSLDINEISAWIDLNGCIAHWADITPTDELFTFITDAWADPEFSIVDLARTVGASSTTAEHYTSVLGKYYAKRRYNTLTSAERNPMDSLNVLTLCIEKRRLDASTPLAISEKCRLKLESGRYGQMPTKYLRAKLSHGAFSHKRMEFLRIDGDREAWPAYMINHYKKHHTLYMKPIRSRPNSELNNYDDSGYVDDNNTESDASADLPPTSSVGSKSSNDDYDDSGYIADNETTSKTTGDISQSSSAEPGLDNYDDSEHFESSKTDSKTAGGISLPSEGSQTRGNPSKSASPSNANSETTR